MVAHFFHQPRHFLVDLDALVSLEPLPQRIQCQHLRFVIGDRSGGRSALVKFLRLHLGRESLRRCILRVGLGRQLRLGRRRQGEDRIGPSAIARRREVCVGHIDEAAVGGEGDLLRAPVLVAVGCVLVGALPLQLGAESLELPLPCWGVWSDILERTQ
mgnify:CR=1 FL=1